MSFEIYKNILIKNWFAILSFFLGLGLLIYLLFIFDISTIIELLRKISIQQFVFIIILKLIFTTTAAWKWKIILDFYKAKISFWKLYWLKHALFAITYFTPPAGAFGEQLVGAFFLKKEKVPFKKGLVSIILDSVLTGIIAILVTFFVIISFILYLVYNLSFSLSTLISFLVTTFLGAIGFSLLRKLISTIDRNLKNKRTSLKFLNELKRAVNLSFSFLKYNKLAFIQVILINFLNYILTLFEIFLILFFLDKILMPMQLALIEAGNVLAFLVPVSQALGITEAFTAYTISVLGLGAPLGITLSLILRARHLTISLIGIIFLIFCSLTKIRKR